MRTTVYVSGPYTSNPLENTEFAIDVGAYLFNAGYAPFVPHLTHYWHEYKPRHYEDWMTLDLVWVAKADCVLRIAGESSGADREVEHAKSLGIPVYDSVLALLHDMPAEQPVELVESGALPAPIVEAIRVATETFANKNADYADDSSWRSNFDNIAQQMGIDAVGAADTLIAVKQARLCALSSNGRTPKNEAVEDTYKDRMVYSIIAYGLLLEDLAK